MLKAKTCSPETIDRAEALDGRIQGVEFGHVRREPDGVGQLVRIDRCGLVAGRSGARVELAVNLDPDIFQGDLLVGGLDQVGMSQAARQRAEQQFGRARPEIVAGEIRRAVADHLEVADADASDAAAPLGMGLRLKSQGAGVPRAGMSLPAQQGVALLGEIFRESGHGGVPVWLDEGIGAGALFRSCSHHGGWHEIALPGL